MNYTHPTFTLISPSQLPDRSHVLRHATQVVSSFDDDLRTVAARLDDALRGSPIAVGLAAPQLGISLRIAAICIDRTKDTIFIVNPTILETAGKKDTKFESCMSLPYLRGRVARRERMRVSYQDLNAVPQEVSVTGFEARVFAHEIDHLEGALYVDHVVGGAESLEVADFFSQDPLYTES